MLRSAGWQIGRILGIPILVHGSWLLVFAFVTWTLATAYLPSALPGQTDLRYWAMGGMAAILLFLSVLLHELGHCWVALRYRIPIGRITLFVFGGVAHMRREAPTPRAEFLIAIAGPIVSFMIGAGCLGGVFVGESAPVGWHLNGLLVLGGLVGSVNVQIGLFNLIPGFPLDGGRALRAGLWAWSNDFHAATRRSAVAGLTFGVLLTCAGGLLIVAATTQWVHASLVTNGMWLAMIGLFLFATAKVSRRQASVCEALACIRTGDVMTRAVVAIPSNITVETAVRDFFLAHGFSGFPVLQHGRVVGIVSIRDLQRIPRKLWVWREVREIMRPVDAHATIGLDDSALEALERMATGTGDRLLVMDGERLVGLVTRSAIWRYVRLQGGRKDEDVGT
ncbi:peptidase M50 [Nitrospira sp.]|nr:peptidase M50 [Nitrospira sp.]